jgi:molybdenum cofactor cytidylyltransferase
MAKLSAIVLAAGISERMGTQNKLLLSWGDQCIMEATINQILKAHLFEIIVVSAHETLRTLKVSDQIKIVENRNYSQGMTSSIKTGIRACDTSSDGFMICLADQPFISSDIYSKIYRAFETNPDRIIAPFFQGKKGNPVVFSRRYESALLNNPNSNGCKSVVEKNWPDIVRVDINQGVILEDIDTPEAYRALKKKYLGN